MTSKQIILTPKVRGFVFVASDHWLKPATKLTWIYFFSLLSHILESSCSPAKEEDTAVDQGGPSRQFLTDVFKQIEILSVNVGTERVSLFQNTNSGVEVVTDELLEHYISKAAAKTSCLDVAAAAAVKQAKKAAADAVKQAKAYVRAIGRIMLHSMANDFTLPAKAMSRFFMTGKESSDCIIMSQPFCTNASPYLFLVVYVLYRPTSNVSWI